MEWLSTAFSGASEYVSDVFATAFTEEAIDGYMEYAGDSLVGAFAETFSSGGSSGGSSRGGVKQYNYTGGQYSSAKAPDAVAPRAMKGVDAGYWDQVFTYYAQNIGKSA